MKDTEAEDNKDILEEEDVNKEEAALNSLSRKPSEAQQK